MGTASHYLIPSDSDKDSHWQGVRGQHWIYREVTTTNCGLLQPPLTHPPRPGFIPDQLNYSL